MELTLWSIRIATALYLLALYFRNRWLWTVGCGLYLVHIWAAFEFHHHWSHAHAYAETARQTYELFGWNWGGGLYFNYLFTLVWTADAACWWIDKRGRATRPLWMTASIHGFLAFMFVNGALVFPLSGLFRR